MFEKLIQFCDSFLPMGLPGYDLAVYKEGKCILRHMNGYNNIDKQTKMNGTERYYIYSCSKPITCTAALQLWEKGLFSLEDKLSDYMPEFKEMMVLTSDGIRPAKNPILVKHLFEMTAGFSYDLKTPYLLKCRKETNGKCPTRETIKYLAKEPLLFEPGTRYEYSLCHDVLAALVEVVSKEKFEIYVQKNIFDVLEMRDSTFMLEQKDLFTLAEQYCFRDNTIINVGKQNSYKIGNEYASGGAGCISTVDDYMKFLEGLRKHILLNPDTVRLMQTDRLSEKQKVSYEMRNEYGYGLGVRCSKGDDKNIDFGWGGAACAYLAVDTKNEISIFFGTHLLNSPVQGLRKLIYRFVRAELLDQSELEEIYEKLQEVYDYHLTY